MELIMNPLENPIQVGRSNLVWTVQSNSEWEAFRTQHVCVTIIDEIVGHMRDATI